MSEYIFRLPIGDWSDDGHGDCEYYYIKSTKPVEEVREAHFLIEEKTGVNIHKICNDYENSYVSADIFNKLLELGFNDGVLGDYVIDGDNEVFLEAKDMSDIWLFLLNQTDPELKLEAAYHKEPEMLPFYGFDEKGRHIGQVGYGTLG